MKKLIFVLFAIMVLVLVKCVSPDYSTSYSAGDWPAKIAKDFIGFRAFLLASNFGYLEGFEARNPLLIIHGTVISYSRKTQILTL
jgi:hypothetical protein